MTPFSRRDFHRIAAGGAAGLALAAAAGRTGAARPPFRVFMIQWRGDTDADRGMMDYLRRAGVEVEFTARDAAQDKAKLAAIVAEAKQARPDLIYAYATEAVLGVVGPVGGDAGRFVTDIPVVFAAVGDPVASNIVPSLDHGGRNLTGVIHLPPIPVQFEALNSFFAPKRLGLLYNSAESYGVGAVRQFQDIAGKADIEIAVETCVDAKGEPQEELIPPALERIAARRPDALYLPSTSFFLPLARPITAKALDLGMPVFSPNEQMMRQGSALAGLVASLNAVGEFAGYKIEQILVRGVAAKDIPIEYLSRFSLLVNMRVARRVQVYPPVTMLRYAELVDAS